MFNYLTRLGFQNFQISSALLKLATGFSEECVNNSIESESKVSIEGFESSERAIEGLKGRGGWKHLKVRRLNRLRLEGKGENDRQEKA
jgi:hypothetical protein